MYRVPAAFAGSTNSRHPSGFACIEWGLSPTMALTFRASGA
jgi:hypothetical protein